MQPVVCGTLELVFERLEHREQSLRRLERHLAPEERRCAEHHAGLEARRFVARRGRLRELLAARLGAAPREIELTRGTYGKPALAGRLASRLHFNVSRSGDFAAYAFSRREVGVDLEQIRELPERDAIAAHAFSPAEKAAYACAGPAERLDEFYRIWTRREAFAKALGTGLALPIDSFDAAVRTFRPAPGLIAAAWAA